MILIVFSSMTPVIPGTTLENKYALGGEGWVTDFSMEKYHVFLQEFQVLNYTFILLCQCMGTTMKHFYKTVTTYITTCSD